MGKPLELKPDRTAVLDRELRGAFREILSGETSTLRDASKVEVSRLSNERSRLITSRNVDIVRRK